jgi:hypothetical protein
VLILLTALDPMITIFDRSNPRQVACFVFESLLQRQLASSVFWTVAVLPNATRDPRNYNSMMISIPNIPLSNQSCGVLVESGALDEGGILVNLVYSDA